MNNLQRFSIGTCHRAEVTYYAADHHEPDDDHHDLSQSLCISSLAAIDRNLIAEKLEADVEIEDGANSNWAEKADESSLSPLFDLMNLLVAQGYEGRSAEK